jgi:hypothetical protein
MNKLHIKFLKIKLKRKLFLKNELKKNILKSIIQNKNVNFLKKQYAQYSLLQFTYNTFKIKNVCLMDGRSSSVSNNFFVSRNSTKKLLNLNKLQNIKINS